MKINIGEHILARGTDSREVPQNLRIVVSREVHIATTLQSTHAKAVDRGNLRTSVHFDVVRAHISPEEATQFVLTHAASLHGLEGTLTLLVECATPATYTLQHACVRNITSHLDGNTSHHHYEIVGGNVIKN